MSAGSDGGLVCDRLEEVYRAKLAAEIAAAGREAPGSDWAACSGDPLSLVLLVKGEPGPGEVSGGAALSGPDGEALPKALAALGFVSGDAFAVVSRPLEGVESEQHVRRLLLVIEAVDPAVILGLDSAAEEDLAQALGIGQLGFGVVVNTAGRRIVCVDGFEASLGDERLKRRVWGQMRVLTPQEPVW